MRGEWGSACSESCGWCGACSEGPSDNATCARCGEDYWKGRDDVGSLCDACCALRDALPADVKDALYVRAVREWDRKAARS